MHSGLKVARKLLNPQTKFQEPNPPYHLLPAAPPWVITKGVFSLEESLESLKSLDSLESLENCRFLLCFPQFGGSLESLVSLHSLESVEDGLL